MKNFFSRFLVTLTAVVISVGLLSSIGDTQTTTLPNFTPANSPLTGQELFWGDQPGNTASPTGPTVKITLPQILQWMQNNGLGSGGSAGVTSFNNRSGAVTLLSSDISSALGFTPNNPGGTNLITGTYTFQGPLEINRRTVNSNTTLTTADKIVCVDTTNGPVNVTMPAAPLGDSTHGQQILIDDCKGTAATNPITITANAGQSIGILSSPLASVQISTQGQSVGFAWNQPDSIWNQF